MSKLCCPSCGAQLVVSAVETNAAVIDDGVSVTPEWLQQAWNEGKSDRQPASRSLTPALQRQARARARECNIRERWRAVIAAIKNSKRHNGENDTHWIADFTYLTRPATFQKIDDLLKHRQLHGEPAAPAGAARQQTRSANAAAVAAEPFRRAGS